MNSNIINYFKHKVKSNDSADPLSQLLVYLKPQRSRPRRLRGLVMCEYFTRWSQHLFSQIVPVT